MNTVFSAPQFSLLGERIGFDVVWRPEIHAEAPTPYAAAMAEMHAREMLLGEQWFRDIADRAHWAYMHKREWWNF